MENRNPDTVENIAPADEAAGERFAHTVNGIAALAEQLSAKSGKSA